MTELKSLHRSKLGRSNLPRNLAMTRLDDASRQMIETEALSIFTEMVNVGQSLQKTLAAIYLSGMSAARGAMQ